MSDYKIEKLLKDAFERGKTTAKKYGSVSASWISYYGFNRDPFFLNPPTRLDEIQLLRGREQILSELGEFVGGSSYLKESYHVKIVGAMGSGKSSLLYTLYLLAKTEFKVIFWDIHYDSPVYSEDYNDEEIDPIKHNKFDVVFFDNCTLIDRSNMRINHRRAFPGLILSTWPPILEKDVDCDRRILLNQLKNSEIIDLIKARLSYGGNDEAINESIIQQVAEHSHGNPWLSVYLLGQVFEEGFIRRQNPIDIDVFNKIANRFHLFGELEFDLTSREQDVISDIIKLILMEGKLGVTSKEIAKSLNISRHLAWKYLERLKDKNILTKSYHGRTTVFKLDKITRIKYELNLMENF